jgi:hypothetical protein
MPDKISTGGKARSSENGKWATRVYPTKVRAVQRVELFGDGPVKGDLN